MLRNKYMAELVDSEGNIFAEWHNASNIKHIKAWARGRGGKYTLVISIAVSCPPSHFSGTRVVAEYFVSGNRVSLNNIFQMPTLFLLS